MDSWMREELSPSSAQGDDDILGFELHIDRLLGIPSRPAADILYSRIKNVKRCQDRVKRRRDYPYACGTVMAAHPSPGQYSCNINDMACRCIIIPIIGMIVRPYHSVGWWGD